jgi:adenine-specific DNA-methyltransferase|tara:strand:- start:596 stop:2284 length:1689 start_codon:yes stop_codon:yes gene_type:complete
MDHLSSKEKKSSGAHYTPPQLAKFVSQRILENWNNSESSESIIRILDPAVGGGELLSTIYKAINEDLQRIVHLVGLDNDSIAVDNATMHLNQLNATSSVEYGDFLNHITGHNENDLFNAPSLLEKADIIIANPPYVRTQVLGAAKSQELAAKFNLKGRIDLSYPFILGMIEMLKPNGIAGIITSNRFLSTKSGASLREQLSDKVRILEIWDLGDTKLFEAAVLPCIIIIQKAPPLPTDKTSFVSVYSEQGKKQSPPDPTKLFNSLSSPSCENLESSDGATNYIIKRGRLPQGQNPEESWTIENTKSRNWLEQVERKTWKAVGEISKVKVGVKTTSDSVFIRDDWDVITRLSAPEVLKPLITHHLAKQFKGLGPTKRILYTHHVVNNKRAPIDLNDYPNTSSYLESNRQKLEGRKYVIEAGRKWFEIWVPQDPRAWDNAKIIFKDISVEPTFWLDESGAVVNGDCYWFSIDGELKWLLLGVLNSKFIEEFYDNKFSNKLYAGRRRYMTQYVSKFPIPDPASSGSKKIIEYAKAIYNDPTKLGNLKSALNKAVYMSFGLSVTKE